MATPATARTAAPALDVATSPIAADTIAAELYEHAERVAGEAGENGQGRVVAARIRSIRRTAGQLEALAAATGAE